jgi:hypothetical protein
VILPQGKTAFAVRNKSESEQAVEACEKLRIPHCLDDHPRYCGEAVSLTHRERSNPEIYFYLSLRLSKCQGLVQPEGLDTFISFN